MKQTMVLLLLFVSRTYTEAQQFNTSDVDRLAREFRTRKHILLRYEMLTNIDSTGRSFAVSRFYYFDKKQRILSSVQEFHDPMNPQEGRRVIYTFKESHLVKVTDIPAREDCINCLNEYYYSADSLVFKKERGSSVNNTNLYLEQATAFRSHVPYHLPWGHFQDEVLVNGKMRKVRNKY